MTPEQLKEEIRKAFQEKKLIGVRSRWGVMTGENEGGRRIFLSSTLATCCGLGSLLVGEETPSWWDTVQEEFEEKIFGAIREKYGLDKNSVRSFLHGWDATTGRYDYSPYAQAGHDLAQELVR